MQQSEVPDFMSELVPDAKFAEAIGKTTRTTRIWRQQGTGPRYIAIGREIFYRREAISQWLREREVQPVRERRRAAR